MGKVLRRRWFGMSATRGAGRSRAAQGGAVVGAGAVRARRRGAGAARVRQRRGGAGVAAAERRTGAGAGRRFREEEEILSETDAWARGKIK